MIKILHLYPEINITCGISKSIYSIVNNTNDTYENYVFCLGGDGIDKYKKAKINTLVYPVNKRSLFKSLKLFFKLFYFVRKKNIDIIHSHHRYFDLIAFIISILISIRTITSVRSKVHNKIHFSYKAQILIACSNAIKKHLIEYFKIDQKKIKVIYNFIDPRGVSVTIQKSDLKKELGIDDMSTIIGFVGRFSIREKGVDNLLESFKKLNISNSANTVLLLIGDGEDKKYINDFINTKNRNVLVLPPKENIFDYYNIIDIVVLPSRVEPFGNVTIEAGLMKKAFIGSNVDGIAEVIENNVNGLLVEAGKPDELAKAIEYLLDNESVAKELGENLYKKVISEFNAEKIIPQYEALYNDIVYDPK